jgi:hypothetical protein
MELIEPELIFGPAIGFPSPENPKPAAFVAVNKVVVTRHVEGTPEPPFMIDAAESGLASRRAACTYPNLPSTRSSAPDGASFTPNSSATARRVSSSGRRNPTNQPKFSLL